MAGALSAAARRRTYGYRIYIDAYVQQDHHVARPTVQSVSERNCRIGTVGWFRSLGHSHARNSGSGVPERDLQVRACAGVLQLDRSRSRP